MLGLSEVPADRPETGLGKETAPIVHDYLHSKVARQTFDHHRKVGVDLTSRREFAPAGAKAKVTGPFAGKVIVLTGQLGEL